MTTEMILGITGTVAGVLGFVVSLSTAWLSFRQHWLDRPKLKFSSQAIFGYNSPFEPFVALTLTAVNVGRRVVVLRDAFVLPKKYHSRRTELRSVKTIACNKVMSLDESPLEEGKSLNFVKLPMSMDYIKNLGGREGVAYVVDTKDNLYRVQFDTKNALEFVKKVESEEPTYMALMQQNKTV